MTYRVEEFSSTEDYDFNADNQKDAAVTALAALDTRIQTKRYVKLTDSGMILNATDVTHLLFAKDPGSNDAGKIVSTTTSTLIYDTFHSKAEIADMEEMIDDSLLAKVTKKVRVCMHLTPPRPSNAPVNSPH